MSTRPTKAFICPPVYGSDTWYRYYTYRVTRPNTYYRL